MAAAFDPTSIAPDWQSQKDALSRLYQQNLINLNAKKGNLMAQYGLQNTGAFDQSGKPLDFSNLQVDPNQQYGAYRNELTSEANMLDSADNGPNRGFSGGVANQARRAAQQAVGARQTQFQQNLQQNLGNLNLEANNQNFQYNEGVNSVNTNAADYGAQAAAWQAMNATAPASYVVPGASGGGSTPLTPQAVQTAASFGYQTISNPTNLKPMTFGKPTTAKTTTRAAQTARNAY